MTKAMTYSDIVRTARVYGMAVDRKEHLAGGYYRLVIGVGHPRTALMECYRALAACGCPRMIVDRATDDPGTRETWLTIEGFWIG